MAQVNDARGDASDVECQLLLSASACVFPTHTETTLYTEPTRFWRHAYAIRRRGLLWLNFYTPGRRDRSHYWFVCVREFVFLIRTHRLTDAIITMRDCFCVHWRTQWERILGKENWRWRTIVDCFAIDTYFLFLFLILVVVFFWTVVVFRCW